MTRSGKSTQTKFSRMSQISKSLATKPQIQTAPGTAAPVNKSVNPPMVNKSPSPKKVRDLEIDDRINLLTDQESTENLAVNNLKSAIEKIKKNASIEEIVDERKQVEFDNLLDLLINDKTLQDSLNRVRKTFCLHQIDFKSLILNSRSHDCLKDSLRLNQNVQYEHLEEAYKKV